MFGHRLKMILRTVNEMCLLQYCCVNDDSDTNQLLVLWQPTFPFVEDSPFNSNCVRLKSTVCTVNSYGVVE